MPTSASVIYEFARVKLRKELYRHFLDGRWPEIEEQVRGLEAAIDRIESDFAQNAPLLQLNSEPALIQATDEQSIHNALALTPGFAASDGSWRRWCSCQTSDFQFIPRRGAHIVANECIRDQ